MQQIKVEDVIGSGPFIFKADEWKPGEKIVYVKNTEVQAARPSRASGLAGGKVVKVDRVEWIWIPDVQTQVAALQNGEIDMIEAPGHDLLPLLGKDKNIKLVDGNPLGNQYAFRFNQLVQAVRQRRRSATPCWSPSARRISSRPRSAIRSSTRSARRRSSAARRSPAMTAWPTC